MGKMTVGDLRKYLETFSDECEVRVIPKTINEITVIETPAEQAEDPAEDPIKKA